MLYERELSGRTEQEKVRDAARRIRGRFADSTDVQAAIANNDLQGLFEALRGLGFQCATLLDEAKLAKWNLFKQTLALKLAAGTPTSAGLTMKCDFDDALIVRESATFKMQRGQTKMFLKDVKGDIAEVSIALVLSKVVPEMALAFETLWMQREQLNMQIKAATSIAQVNALKWD